MVPNIGPYLTPSIKKGEDIMPIRNYQRAEVTVIGESLSRLLEVGNVSQRLSLKDVICRSLQEAYENTAWVNYIVDIDIPGGPGKSPSERGREDPRQPGDEIEEEYERTDVGAVPQENPHKMELLNEGLHWGCKWAQQEIIRLGGKLPLNKKKITKK